jgi:isopentenyl-diphosphate Delta-isomerase
MKNYRMGTEIQIPLVNDADEIIGHAEKLYVHRNGLLHRAFSILIFNHAGQLLIHQRAFEKYHSPGLWTNTCCGHPNQNESMEAAVHRRLLEEMGIITHLTYAFTFRYKAVFDNGLTEHEIDHVYTGYFDEPFKVNPEEVADFLWVYPENIIHEVNINPEKYTYWFREILKNKTFLNFISERSSM